MIRWAIAALAALLAVPASAGNPMLFEDRTVAAIDERAIRFYIDRPDSNEQVPLLLLVDGSGCVGQRRASSWHSYDPAYYPQHRYARLMVEKPGVDPHADDFAAPCSEDFRRYYDIDSRVTDHLRVLQHLAATADWWNGELLVWGWSDGGDIAARLVAYRPQTTRAVLGAMGGGLTMEEHFERFWACPEGRFETDAERERCLADLRGDFARIHDNPTWQETWSGHDNTNKVWATRLRARLSAPLADNRVPLLIVHGELDADSTPVESARALVADLTANGNTAFTYWEVPGMKHGWDDLPDDRQSALVTGMLDWLMTGSIDGGKRRRALELSAD